MTATRQILQAATLIFLFVALAGVAEANNQTRVNITIQETVNQNVTFAENFDLVENRTYSFIEGVITVSNPGDESVEDISVRLDNIGNLATNINYRSGTGREGFQTIFPDEENNYTLNQTITTSYLTLPLDIDEDGINDSVTHNDTHLIFNLTSEFELFSIPFSDGGSTVDLTTQPTTLDMDFNLTSAREDTSYNDGLNFANVRISGDTASLSEIDPAVISFNITDYERNYAVLHIPQLRPGNFSVFDYAINSISVDAPLNITTEYTNPEFNTKVLAGEKFGIRITAGNIATVGNLEDVNITLRAEQVDVINGSVTETFNFTIHNLSDNVSISDDYTNVDNSSNRTWYWPVNGGTIALGEDHNISFQIRAPDTVATSNTYLALTQLLAYRIPTTASELEVGEVRARAGIRFNESKRIVSPQDSADNRNVTWGSDPNVGTDKNITFTLEKVSLWVTEVRDPNQRTGIETDYFPTSYDFNQTTPWNGGTWYFNFTDGSQADSPPPIIWMKPYWIIKNTDNQIVNSSVTVNGTDLYMNYIYVVGGYWLEVDKQVIDTGDGQYNISTQVYNRGNGHTPQNMTVTVYDFIAENFDAYNFNPGPGNASNVTGEFGGVAYQWDVGLRTNISTSFSPRGSADGLDEWNMSYQVNGSGDFQVSDLYIVGLDPRLVDGANTYEGVAVISAIASTSREILYLAIVVFLIGINLANFMMTSRINRKLGP